MNAEGSSPYAIEHKILRDCFEQVNAIDPQDNEISKSKFVRQTVNKLKAALRGVSLRCTCAKRTWGGICELCQASPPELHYLRNFFRFVRDAKKNNISACEMRSFIASARMNFFRPANNPMKPNSR